ncbi:hypothetical protein PSPO01_16006 [Paraphaeosphaeria sporulosa]
MIRLLKRLPSGDFELISFNDEDTPPYAILSHTWTEGQEVTYNELVAGTGKSKTGYAKISFCGERAAADGFEYCWVDTCCIDKSSSNELSTAINSMFRYYQRAAKCYVYLSDVQVPEEVTDVPAFRLTWEDAFRRSRWFTRGWTLQELLAPATVDFFSKEGKRLGSRVSLEQEIHEVTKIPIQALRGQRLAEFSVDERMRWAENRKTTVKEDKSYCLLGIFEVFIPLIYGEGEAYATLRLREEIRRRQEERRAESLQDLTVSSSLPFPRNELFVGREDELQHLEQFLLPNTHRRMAIHGLGGCGKSALALELAYRALARHGKHLIFWVPAISQESFELAFREVGLRVRIPGITDDNADIKQLVKEALSSDSMGDWLMIVDNADDPRVLMAGGSGDPGSSRLLDYLPYGNRGKILFTTRSRKAAGELTPSGVLELDDMSKAEAGQLLARRITKQALRNDQKAVDKLLESLAYLPLAIVQAAAFINNNDISVSGYVSLFQKIGTETELFSEHFEDPSRYREMESTIAKTWHISFDQIRRQDSLAAEYLSYMACIDRINVPQSLLPPGGSALQQAKAVGTLKGYAFIMERQQASQELESETFFDIHRLVHMASIWWLKEHGEWTACMDKVVSRLEEVVPYGGYERKGAWTKYLPHAIHVATLDSTLDETTRASLLDRVGRCQASLGQYSAAETTHRQVFSLREKTLGKEHISTLTSMNEVGVALDIQGKHDAAETMHRQTLATKDKVLGKEHLETLTSMNNLALVLEKQGRYEAAEAMHRQTLVICEKVLGKEHPKTLMSMNNLALVLDRQGKYEAAEAMHRQTLAKKEKVLGKEHPETLTSMNNLARVLDNQGDYKTAEAMHKQTLAGYEKVLGKEHPHTLMSMSNLAGVLKRQGKYEVAEAMYRQTLVGYEKVLGKEHSETLMCMSNLAGVLDSQGNHGAVEVIYRQTLAGLKKVLGKEHPHTLANMNNLARVLDSQGKYEAAEAMNRQAVAGYEKVLGKKHPSTLMSMNNLAGMLDRRGNHDAAEAIYRQTLTEFEKVLGKEHPEALTSMNNLALVLDNQGKYEAAEAMHRQTVAGSEKVLGKEHPLTLTSMNNLAGMLVRRGDYDAAEVIYRQTLAGYENVLGKEHPETQMSMNNIALVLDRQASTRQQK